jgi:hypothetical protein
MFDAFTDYPITQLGDIENERAPIRKCKILTYDRDKYADVMVELWGDGTQFGMNAEMVGALNNAFREVAVKFALVVADKAYGVGYDHGWEDGGKNGYGEGWSEGVDSVRSGVLGD